MVLKGVSCHLSFDKWRIYHNPGVPSYNSPYPLIHPQQSHPAPRIPHSPHTHRHIYPYPASVFHPTSRSAQKPKKKMCGLTPLPHTHCPHPHSYIITSPCSMWSWNGICPSTSLVWPFLQQPYSPLTVMKTPMYCEYCFENSAALRMELAIQEAEYCASHTAMGKGEKWGKVRMQSEKFEFRERCRREMTGLSS